LKENRRFKIFEIFKITKKDAFSFKHEKKKIMSKKNSKSKFHIVFYAIVITLVLLIPFSMSHSTESSENKKKKEEKEEVVHHGENSNCFKCHGKRKYTMLSSDSSQSITRLMPSEYFIDTVAYYKGTHKSFKCSDCHSEEYATTPHNGDLRFEPIPSCIDCHGGDPEYEKYRFEQIEEQVQKSVHIKGCSDQFSCWRCHDAHSYKSTARENLNIKELIAYDNGMCLKCHASSVDYMLFSENETPNLIQKHDWLPNQANHFKNVRCIECHTPIVDSMLVGHNIMPKEKAVKGCVECHSSDSRLMHTLYKFQAKERRNEQGFFNGAILSGDSYVIGANRNYFLNVASIAIFALVVIGILIHGILRIILKKKNNVN